MMNVLINHTTFWTYWKPIWLSSIIIMMIFVSLYFIQKHVTIDSNKVGDLVIKYFPKLLSAIIMVVGIFFMNAKTFDFDSITREKNQLILSHKKWLSMNPTIIDIQNVQTIKKCRMSVRGIKKAMVLQIVLSNDVYTSEIIHDVEKVSKNLAYDLHLQFSSGELCEYRK